MSELDYPQRARQSMPASTLDAIGFRLTPGGTPIADDFVRVTTDTGLYYRATLQDAGGTHWVFTPAPSCADIDAAFATCAELDSAVLSCSALDSWGYT